MIRYIMKHTNNQILGVYDADPTVTVVVRAAVVAPQVLDADGAELAAAVNIAAVTEGTLPATGAILETYDSVDAPLVGGTLIAGVYAAPVIEYIKVVNVSGGTLVGGVYEVAKDALVTIRLELTNEVDDSVIDNDLYCYRLCAVGLPLSSGKVTLVNGMATITFTPVTKGYFTLCVIPITGASQKIDSIFNVV